MGIVVLHVDIYGAGEAGRAMEYYNTGRGGAGEPGIDLPRLEKGRELLELMRDLTFMPKADTVARALAEGMYVATAEFPRNLSVPLEEDLEDVFGTTQNGVRHDSWSRQAKGAEIFGGGVRREGTAEFGYKSSSVGDVFVADGEAWLVAGTGFRKLDVPARVFASVPLLGEDGRTLDDLLTERGDDAALGAMSPI